MSEFNGHRFDLGALFLRVGEMANENSRQTEIILSHIARSDQLHRDIMKNLDRLPDRIVQRIPPPGGDFSMKTLFLILQSIPPILFIAAIVVARLSGQIDWEEAIAKAISVLGNG